MLCRLTVSRTSSEQGNVTLLAVLLVMMLASGVLRLSSHSLHYGSQQVNDEKNYLRAFYQAQSALAWGLNYRWSPSQGWQCPTSPTTTFSLCLWRGTDKDGWLRGSSERGEWLLWQRVTFSKKAPSHPQRHPRGWIDECPLLPDLCRGPLSRDGAS